MFDRLFRHITRTDVPAIDRGFIDLQRVPPWPFYLDVFWFPMQAREQYSHVLASNSCPFHAAYMSPSCFPIQQIYVQNTASSCCHEESFISWSLLSDECFFFPDTCATCVDSMNHCVGANPSAVHKFVLANTICVKMITELSPKQFLYVLQKRLHYIYKFQ